MVRFGKNGNDATTAAIRLARHYMVKTIYYFWLSFLARLVCWKTSKNSGVPNEISNFHIGLFMVIKNQLINYLKNLLIK